MITFRFHPFLISTLTAYSGAIGTEFPYRQTDEPGHGKVTPDTGSLRVYMF